MVIVDCFFFFQAEDGIRDLVRSRGLGDVYKRQIMICARAPCARPGGYMSSVDVGTRAPDFTLVDQAVSYTHLTLPTSDLV